MLAQVRKKYREDSDRGKESADLENETNAFPICQRSKQRRADTADAEDEAEEQTGHHTHAARHQLLSIDHDGWEGRGENETDLGRRAL